MATAAQASAVDWWALAFAIAATVAAIVAAVWGWVDRPQQTWWYQTVREAEWKPRDGGGEVLRIPERHEQHAVDATIRATGAPMFNASLYVEGCSVIGKRDERTVFAGALAPGTDPPLRVKVLVPAGHDPAYVGLVWVRRRPLTHFGARLNLRMESDQEVWRWRWRSLRVRRAGWRVRLVRTRGRWVPHMRSLLAEIPPPE